MAGSKVHVHEGDTPTRKDASTIANLYDVQKFNAPSIGGTASDGKFGAPVTRVSGHCME